METDEFSPLMRLLDRIQILPDEEKEYFRSFLKIKRLKKGDFFIRAGERVHHVGFLVSGLIRYYYISDTGKEFIKHFCFDGHFVTSYIALQTEKESDYFIEAIEETRLIVFAYDDWMKLLRRHPVWGIINAQVQAEALIEAEKRERSLILDDAATRYLNLLKDIPGIESRVKQYDLANYLGISAVALSRIRNKTNNI